MRLVLTLLLVLLPAALPAQQLSRVERERAQVMLRQVRDQVEEHYHDTTFAGRDRAADYAEAETRIAGATSLDEALAAIAQYTLQLADWHTIFAPPTRTVHVDYGWSFQMVGDSAFVDQVDRGSDADRQGVRPGDVVLSVNGYRPTRENITQLLYLYYLLRPQPGLRAVLGQQDGESRQLDLAAETHSRERILDLTGDDGGDDLARYIRSAQRDARELTSTTYDAGDGVLIWRLPTFMVERSLVRTGIARAREGRSLVLDLRGNSGGSLKAMLELIGLLHHEDITVATVHSRNSIEPLEARSKGSDGFTGQLIVLVDARSASAAELVARTVQLTERGLVLGDHTAGSVKVARHHLLRQGTQTVIVAGVNVAEARIVMPDGNELEGVGVEPDSVVLPRSADLRHQRDPLLASALALTGLTVTPEEAGRIHHRD